MKIIPTKVVELYETYQGVLFSEKEAALEYISNPKNLTKTYALKINDSDYLYLGGGSEKLCYIMDIPATHN